MGVDYGQHVLMRAELRNSVGGSWENDVGLRFDVGRTVAWSLPHVHFVNYFCVSSEVVDTPLAPRHAVRRPSNSIRKDAICRCWVAVEMCSVGRRCAALKIWDIYIRWLLQTFDSVSHAWKSKFWRVIILIDDMNKKIKMFYFHSNFKMFFDFVENGESGGLTASRILTFCTRILPFFQTHLWLHCSLEHFKFSLPRNTAMVHSRERPRLRLVLTGCH